LLYEGAIFVLIAVPLIIRKLSPLEVKLTNNSVCSVVKSLNPLPPGTIHVSMDVTYLYMKLICNYMSNIENHILTLPSINQCFCIFSLRMLTWNGTNPN